MKIGLIGLAVLLTFCSAKAQNQADGLDPLPLKPVPLSDIVVDANNIGLLVEANNRGTDHFVVVNRDGRSSVQDGRIDGNFAVVALNLVHNPYARIVWRPSKTATVATRVDSTLVRALMDDAKAATRLSSVGSPCNKVYAVGTVHSPLDDMQRQQEPPAILVYWNGEHTNPLGCDPKAVALKSHVARILAGLAIR